MPDFDALQVFLGLGPIFAALVAFILLQTIGEGFRRRRLRKISYQDLTAELEQNLQHQSSSKFIELEDEAYRRFRRRGFLPELEPRLRQELIVLYSRVHEKNDLLGYYRIFMTSAPADANRNTILTIIDRAEIEINKQIKKLIPELSA
jgi:hypothetical protein